MTLLVAIGRATAIPRATSCAASAVGGSNSCAAGQECWATETRGRAMKRVTGDIIARAEKKYDASRACWEDDDDSIQKVRAGELTRQTPPDVISKTGHSRRNAMTRTMRAATTGFVLMLAFGISASA